MKTLPLNWNEDMEPDYAGEISGVDWKASPQDVLEAIDARLKDHGLQVVLFEDESSDTVLFAIEPLNAEEKKT